MLSEIQTSMYHCGAPPVALTTQWKLSCDPQGPRESTPNKVEDIIIMKNYITCHGNTADEPIS